MKKVYSILTALVIGSMVCAPQSLSQQRGRQNYGGGHRTEQHNPGKPSGKPSGKPADKPSGKPSGSTRPGGGNHKPDQGYRPGGGNHKPDQGYRPGGGNHKPDQGFRPGGGNHKPGPDHGFRPGGQHPGHDRYPAYHNRPPRIPGMYQRTWTRPVPPPGYAPRPGGPRFSSILGLTIGTAIDLSLRALISNGYTITGYGPSSVYLTGVNMMGCYWPNATLNYVNNSLRGSEFVYSTYSYDRGRYDRLYREMTNLYGVPVATNINGSSVSATWWGSNNSYVTLSYFPDYDTDGIYRYYTVLSLGD